MPIDVEAEILWNRRLSADYNVLALSAPGIAAAVAVTVAQICYMVGLGIIMPAGTAGATPKAWTKTKDEPEM